jgi:hypothetical protein
METKDVNRTRRTVPAQMGRSIMIRTRRLPDLPAASARKPRRYLRKQDVRARYGWKAALSVDRAWKLYRTLPPPTTWQSRSPLWDEAILDQHDAANAQAR